MTERDVPGVLELYTRVYPGRGEAFEQRAAHMRLVLLEHPWSSDTLQSLVCEDGNGRVTGFLGVVPRPMLLNGRPIRMAVSHHFMVDPTSRGTLAGVKLLQAFLASGQELSMCEGNDSSRKIWEALGGTTSLLQSMFWLRPLRPMGHTVFRLRKVGLPSPLAAILSPVGSLLDQGFTSIRRSPFHLPPSSLLREEADSTTLLESIEKFSRSALLRPVYDKASLEWLLAILAAQHKWGTLRTTIVRSQDGALLGHYIFYVNRGGVSEVVQVGAAPGSMGLVLDELALEARERGAVALAGRLDPRYSEEAPGRPSFCRYFGSWLLIHTSDPELQRAIYRGDAFLTRLEGEWWIPFHQLPDRHVHG